MKLNTAAAVISHMTDLEQASADIYEQWAMRLPRYQETFRGLADENRKNATRIRQAYYHAVTDALETAFSFEGLSAEIVLPDPSPQAAATDVLRAALRLEGDIKQFYEKAAASSKLLFADVSRVMGRLAQSRTARQDRIMSALQSIESPPAM